MSSPDAMGPNCDTETPQPSLGYRPAGDSLAHLLAYAVHRFTMLDPTYMIMWSRAILESSRSRSHPGQSDNRKRANFAFDVT